jgi:16S rRNA (guanine(966)-N(2))-methyltransferase RsmD
MRVISGIYKGRKLQASKDLSIRPTTDRVKEYIFNILQDFQYNKKVVDIFSGSGNLGIEALSRGASHICFVENSRQSITILQKNIKTIGIDTNLYTINNTSAERYVLSDHSDRHVYFLDPPFNFPQLQILINNLTFSEYFYSGNLIVLEHEVSNPIETENKFYNILKQKKMGRSLISFLEKRI